MMDDVIYREDALERLRSIPADLGRRELDDSIKAIENMPSAQQWIPCSERLPEEPGRYMVTDKYGDVRFAMYSTKIPMWWGGANQPTAWMPLPAPYRKEVQP